MLPRSLSRALPAVAARSYHVAARTQNTALSRSTSTLFANQSAASLKNVRTFASTQKMATNTRTESDAFGELQVDASKYWGCQTERSLGNFRINQPQDRMPPPLVKAFGILKGAAATVNMKYGLGRSDS
jgi:fumarate hydratase class II